MEKGGYEGKEEGVYVSRKKPRPPGLDGLYPFDCHARCLVLLKEQRDTLEGLWTEEKTPFPTLSPPSPLLFACHALFLAGLLGGWV